MYVWLVKLKAGRLSESLKNIAKKLKINYKEGIDMVDMYVALVMNGRRTLEQVPEKYREAVRLDLEALGLDGNGNPVSITSQEHNAS